MHTVQHITVTSSSQAYVTGTIRGERASATGGPQFAAQRLAEKLFGPALISVEELKEGDQFTTRWLATADEEDWASVDNEGRIHIFPVIPPANTGLARGPERALRQVIRALAQPVEPDATGSDRVVPGVAEAATREAKDQAIERWLRQHSHRNGKKGSLSVFFATTIVRAQL